jgi:diacylglycerol kinase (ATP)
VHVAIVHNPAAGLGRAAPSDICSAVAEAGHTVTYRPLDDQGWRNGDGLDADLVVAAGGDGTVSEVFTRLSRWGPCRLAILPLGTANNIARSLGVPLRDIPTTASSWAGAPERRFDLPVADLGSREVPFAEAFGSGVFEDHLRRADRGAATATAPGQPIRSLAVSMMAGRPQRWSVMIDGRAVVTEALGVEIMNINQIGPNVALAPRADPGDGLLDVVIIRSTDRTAILAHLAARARGAAARAPRLHVERGRRVRLLAPVGTAFHVDGRHSVAAEPRASRRVGIRAAADTHTVLVPGRATMDEGRDR